MVVHDEDQPRGMWRLGRVERLIEGTDILVRGAVVKVGFKNRRSAILKRPIQTLYPLEVNDRKQPTGLEHRESPASDQQPNRNPRRAAAL